MRDPATLIVGDGAVWTTVAASQDPVVMGPVAVWLWLGTFFLVRHAAAALERPRR